MFNKKTCKRLTVNRKLVSGLMLAITGLICGSIQAELPPQAYVKLKAESEEYLKIRVTHVGPKRPQKHGPTYYTVQAKVLSVSRSKAGLRRGDTIHFESFIQTVESGVPGATWLPEIKRKWTGRVYLNGFSEEEKAASSMTLKNVFELSAHSQSYEPGPLSRRLYSRETPTDEELQEYRRLNR